MTQANALTLSTFSAFDTVTHRAACFMASRNTTDAALVGRIVSLRRDGIALRQIAKQVNRHSETVRLVLIRYEIAVSDLCDNEAAGLTQNRRPLPSGHPVALRGLWQGLTRSYNSTHPGT